MSEQLIEKAKNLFDHQRPFVLYRRPYEDELHLLAQHSDALHYADDYTESGFLIAPFNLDQSHFIIRSDVRESAQIAGAGIEISGRAEMIEDAVAEQQYIKLVNFALKEIEQKTIDKVVVSRRISLPCNSIPFTTFQYLLAQYANALSYMWYHPKLGCWMGASPELFLSAEEGELLTYSLAGTQAYVGEEMPSWALKDKEEQAIVTRYILEKLSDIGLRSEASEPQSVRAANLWHLRSEIRAHTKNPDLKRIFRALHPTPAICGRPKSAALKFILEHENYDRKFYTGFLGELNLTAANSCNLFVNLRCMEWSDQTAHIYVGGGITAKSDPEAEWLETQHKSLTILNALFNSSK